ncbi:MAG: hypothetical protein ACI9R3_006489 [Verrucomicrobiales bacterium]|jgi:hypothetical protein
MKPLSKCDWKDYALAAFIGAIGFGLTYTIATEVKKGDESVDVQGVPKLQDTRKLQNEPAQLSNEEGQVVLSRRELIQSETDLERLGELGREWASGDPNEFFEAFVEMKPSSAKLFLGHALFETWVSSDPRAALAAASQLGSLDRLQYMQRMLVAVSNLNNRQTYLDVIAAMPFDTVINGSGSVSDSPLIPQWARDDPKSFTAAMEEMPPGIRSKLILHFATTLAHADSSAALAWAKTLSPLDRHFAMDPIGKSVVQSGSIEAAKQFVLENTNGDLRSELVTDLAKRMAGSNLEAAVDWIATVGGAAAQAALPQIVAEVKQEEVVSTLELMQGLENASLRSAVSKTLVELWMRNSPTEALRWVSKNPDSGVDSQLAKSFGGQWSSSAEEAVAAFARIGDEGLRQAFWEGYGQRAVGEAMIDDNEDFSFPEQIQSLPEAEREFAQNAAAEIWAQQHPVGASEAILQESAESQARYGPQVFWPLYNSSPEEAVQWYDKLSPEGRISVKTSIAFWPIEDVEIDSLESRLR